MQAESAKWRFTGNLGTMRRKDKEIVEIDVIHRILAEARVCRLAMIDGDRPYIVPMCFGYRDNAIYMHSALKGKKIEVLQRHSEVCFEVDTGVDTLAAEDPCGWSMRYQSVIGFGTAVFLTAPEEKRAALGIIISHYSDMAVELPYSKITATAVIRVGIHHMTGKASGY